MTLWIFLDNIIVWAPSILHFKGLGMRNLQYEMRICQKSHNNVSKTVYVWFEFLWIRCYLYLVAKEANGLFGLARLKFMAAPLRYVASHYLLAAALTSLTHRSSFTYNIAPQWAESINPVQRLLTVRLISDFFRTFWCICFN